MPHDTAHGVHWPDTLFPLGTFRADICPSQRHLGGRPHLPSVPEGNLLDAAPSGPNVSAKLRSVPAGLP